MHGHMNVKISRALQSQVSLLGRYYSTRKTSCTRTIVITLHQPPYLASQNL